MARNIEIKARIESVEARRPKAAALANHGPIECLQDDTFFTCERGRLKLRALSATEGPLIFYQRAHHTGPKESFFLTAPTSSPDALREALSLAYGQVGRVRKHRTLYHIGRTRVHLDRVAELGHFLELEVVLAEGEQAASGIEEAHKLMAALGIAPTQLIKGAYVDLLAQKQAEHRRAGDHQSSPLLRRSGYWRRLTPGVRRPKGGGKYMSPGREGDPYQDTVHSSVGQGTA